MTILKRIISWRQFTLPPLQEPRFFPLATAYACRSCRSIQKSAPRGVCQRCGSGNIFSVDHALNWIDKQLHIRLEEAKEKKRKTQAEATLAKNQARVNAWLDAQGLDQSPQVLTEFREGKKNGYLS